MKTYLGCRMPGETIVVFLDEQREGHTLPLCDKQIQHSRIFEWGSGTAAGAAQLSFAILFDHFRGNLQKVRSWYHTYKWKVIADIPGDTWEITSDQIDLALAEIRQELDRGEVYAGI